MPVITYMSIDPGEHCGYACFNDSGELILSGWVSLDVLDMHLENGAPEIVIYEDFKVMPWKKQGGSNVPAAQGIAIIKNYCKRNKKVAYAQSNTVKPIAYKWAGLKKRKGHGKDEEDAIAHGVYYLQSHDITQSRLLEEE